MGDETLKQVESSDTWEVGTYDFGVEMHQLPLGDPSPGGLHLLLPVLIVLVEQIHSRQGQHHERPHQAGWRARALRHLRFTMIELSHP